MNLARTMTRLSLACAVTAATTVPALALENEFHGMFRLRAITSNFDDGGGGSQFSADPAKPGTLNKKHPKSATFIDERARLVYTAKVDDELKMVTHFEIDSRWGDNSYNSNSTTRNNGAAIGADQVNLETKNVYLDYTLPNTSVNTKLGLHYWNAGYKGIILNDDQAGVSVNAKVGKGSLAFAYFRLDDALTGESHVANGTGTATTTATGTTAVANAKPGKRTRDFLSVGGKYNVNKDFMVGADYELLYSDVLKNTQDSTAIHMLGVNAAYVFGPATVDGFFVYQTGKLGRTGVAGNGQDVSAFAANLGGKVKLGPGAARVNLLYVSGDSTPNSGGRSDFQTIMERGATTNAHGFTASEMVMMLDNKYNHSAAQAVVKDLNNNSQGLVGGFLGYDLNIGKFFAYSNLGFGAVAKDNGFGLAPHKSDFLGTEINTEIGYKLKPNMSVSFVGAYMLLGDYFKGQAVDVAGANPADPYTTRIMVSYAF
jgi:hypothetical protein